MGSTRIKGNKGTLKLGTPGVDFLPDLSNCVLEADDSDETLTFEDAANGGRRAWKFTISGVQSNDSDAAWTYIWSNTGLEVAYTYAPHGNASPSTTQPHFTGMLKIGPKPSIGGEASITGDYTFDYELQVIGEPTMVTTAG